MLKLETGSNTGSDTLTHDPTRPGQNRWPGDPWPRDPVSSLLDCAARCKFMYVWLFSDAKTVLRLFTIKHNTTVKLSLRILRFFCRRLIIWCCFSIFSYLDRRSDWHSLRNCMLWNIQEYPGLFCKALNVKTHPWQVQIHTRMRGNAQLDGRPLLPPSECYRVVNASPLNYDRRVGQNSGPIFSRLSTKVHQINFACPGVSVVCNAVFRSAMSCWVPENIRDQVAKLSQIAPKFHVFFGPPNFGGEGALKISDQIS